MAGKRSGYDLATSWQYTIGFAMLQVGQWRLFVFVLAVVWVVPPLSALIVEGREYRGEKVNCVHGGTWIVEESLGVYGRAQTYEQVFTGTVQSAVETTFTDKLLQIVPDEVFVGTPAGEITATVNQACLPQNLPEIKAGDKWVFYLRTKMYLHLDVRPYLTNDGLMVVSDSPSKPVAQGQNDICLLRHHSDVHESCDLSRTPRHARICCHWEEQYSPRKSPLPRPVQFQFPSMFQSDGINLMHITAPCDFRTYDFKVANATGIVLAGQPVASFMLARKCVKTE